MLNLFSTEDPLLNPSKYRNPILTSLINQYRKTRDDHVQWQINLLLAQDMPVIFIWNTYDPIQLQEKVKEAVFPDNEDWEKEEVYAYKWRYDIYSHYSIVHSVRLDKANALNKENFGDFLMSSLFTEDELKSGFDFFNWKENKVLWDRMPYYVFSNASLLR